MIQAVFERAEDGELRVQKSLGTLEAVNALMSCASVSGLHLLLTLANSAGETAGYEPI